MALRVVRAAKAVLEQLVKEQYIPLMSKERIAEHAQSDPEFASLAHKLVNRTATVDEIYSHC